MLYFFMLCAKRPHSLLPNNHYLEACSLLAACLFYLVAQVQALVSCQRTLFSLQLAFKKWLHQKNQNFNSALFTFSTYLNPSPIDNIHSHS